MVGLERRPRWPRGEPDHEPGRALPAMAREDHRRRRGRGTEHHVRGRALRDEEPAPLHPRRSRRSRLRPPCPRRRRSAGRRPIPTGTASAWTRRHASSGTSAWRSAARSDPSPSKPSDPSLGNDGSAKDGKATWDTIEWDEGVYEMRAVASDQASNPPAEGLEATADLPIAVIVDRTTAHDRGEAQGRHARTSRSKTRSRESPGSSS